MDEIYNGWYTTKKKLISKKEGERKKMDKKTPKKEIRSRKVEGRDKNKDLTFRYININGINEDKEDLLWEVFYKNKETYNIVCLTETHRKVECRGDPERFTTLRKLGEKKGGGLEVRMRKEEQVNLEKKESKSSDILEIEGKCYGKEMKIILVYFDANKNAAGKERNRAIKKEIEEKIENTKDKGLMIIGDFNGHLELLEENRKTDENGKTILSWMETYNLILLNADEKCKGIYTRTRGTQKSAIDWTLVNKEMYGWCEKMEIDEDKEILDCSDHNLLSVTLNIRKADKNKFRKAVWVEGEYYRKDEIALEDFRKEMSSRWRVEEAEKVENMITDMKEGADITLKKTFKRKIAADGEKKIEEKEWMNEDIRRERKESQKLNREKRNCKDESLKEELEEAYETKKRFAKVSERYSH